MNSPYSHTVHARRSLRNEADDGGPYSGPAQIVQTATTLINVHPTAGYRKFSRNHAGGAGAGGNEYRLSEKHQSVHNQQTPSHSGAQSWTSKSTSTTTELNMYQNGKKVLSFTGDVPGGHMNYPYSHPAYQSQGSLDEHNSSPSERPPPPPHYSDYDYHDHQIQRLSSRFDQRPPQSWIPESTSTTTELNMYQGDKKVVGMKVDLPGGHMNYPYPHPPYHFDNSYNSRPNYNTPPPESYIRPPPPPPPHPMFIHVGHVDDQRNNYGGPPSPPPPPPPPTTQTPYYFVNVGNPSDPRDNYRNDNTPTSTTEEVTIKIRGHKDQPDNDEKQGPDGKKKYKVLICKLQQQ